MKARLSGIGFHFIPHPSAFILHLCFPLHVNFLSVSFSLLDKFPTTFPQKLWKSLWISRFFTLQVSENFRLLAFCTLTRQTFTDSLQRAAFALETRPLQKKLRLYHPVLRRRGGQLLMRQTATPRLRLRPAEFKPAASL